MGTPKGMRNHAISLQSGDQVQVYSNAEHIYLQMRCEVPTEQDILTPSFKIAAELTPTEALSLAVELLTLASSHLTARSLS
jgi:hypothetical protein